MSKNLAPLPATDDDDTFAKKEYKRPDRKFMTRDTRLQILGRQDKDETFNLDTYQLNKLSGILERIAVRKKSEKEYDPSLSRNEIRLLQMEEIVVNENEEYKKQRAINSSASERLRYAITGDELLLRQLIFRNGKNVINMRDAYNGRNALHEATAAGHLHIVKMFLDEFRANPNIPTLLGSTTALHIAVEKGYRQMASMLITFGAEVNARDGRGCTPLHCCNTRACCKLLMKFDIDATIKNNEHLLASQFYWKYTDEDDKIAEIRTILEREEERKARDKMRQNKLMYEAAWARETGDNGADFPDARTMETSFENTAGDKVKNAYNYKKKEEEGKKKSRAPPKGRGSMADYRKSQESDSD